VNRRQAQMNNIQADVTIRMSGRLIGLSVVLSSPNTSDVEYECFYKDQGRKTYILLDPHGLSVNIDAVQNLLDHKPQSLDLLALS